MSRQIVIISLWSWTHKT